MKGKLNEALEVIKKNEGVLYTGIINGWINFLKGNNDESIEEYEKALKDTSKSIRKKKVYFTHIGGLFFILALLKTQNPVNYQKILTYIEISDSQNKNNFFYDAIPALKAATLLMLNRVKEAKELIYGIQKNIEKEIRNSIQYFFIILALYWIDQKKAEKQLLFTILIDIDTVPTKRFGSTCS